jgi:hypothetical protein
MYQFKSFKVFNKCHSTKETARDLEKAVSAGEITPPKEVTTRNYFNPLKTSMDTESTEQKISHVSSIAH